MTPLQTLNARRDENAQANAAEQDAPADNIVSFAHGPSDGEAWLAVLDAANGNPARLKPEWQDLFGPIICSKPGVSHVVGQLGQSLDGRIATQTGHSKYINGERGLLHLHRLRCLVDAVVIGVGTAIADDPLLTVRMCSGRHPARVVIDPNGRLPPASRLLRDDGSRCIVVRGVDMGERREAHSYANHVEMILLPRDRGALDPNHIIAALGERGLFRILIEGGAQTISRFIQAGALDRLHVLIAPIILGSGQTGLDLPVIDRLDDAIRPRAKAHIIGTEVIFDCDFASVKA